MVELSTHLIFNVTVFNFVVLGLNLGHGNLILYLIKVKITSSFYMVNFVVFIYQILTLKDFFKY